MKDMKKELKTHEDTMNLTIERLDDLYDELEMRISPTELKGIQGVFLGMKNDVSIGISALHEQFCDYINTQCPLQDTTELRKSLSNIKDELEEAFGCDEFNINVIDDYNKLHKALGGNNER